MIEYGLVQAVLLFTAFYTFGFFYAIPGLILMVIAIDYVLDKLGYTRLCNLD